MPRLQGRMKRISAANPNLKKGAVKRLAAKRAASYRSNQQTSGLKRGGKKGSVKSMLFKSGGTKTELKAYRAMPKSKRASLKHQMRSNRRAGIGHRAQKVIRQAAGLD